MSSRRSRSDAAVSLFPFLAVLVCAMGALILLLLAMTQKIRQQQLAREQALRQQITTPVVAPPARPVPRRAPPAPVVSPVNEEFAAERRRRRAAWQQALEDAQSRRTDEQLAAEAAQQAVASANQKLDQSRARLQEARDRSRRLGSERQSLEASARKLLQEQEQVGEQVALTERDLSALKQRLANASTRFELIPYDGTSGTVRRPIYIECTDKGFRILPEDEFLPFASFRGFGESFNPLLNGVRVLVNYWNQKRHAGGPDEPEPYLLFLVRPSGTLSFYDARKLLERVSTPFGYELIEEDFPLQTPKPDAMAQSLLREAITDTLAMRDRSDQIPEAKDAYAGIDRRSVGTSRAPLRILPDSNDAGYGSGSGLAGGVEWMNEGDRSRSGTPGTGRTGLSGSAEGRGGSHNQPASGSGAGRDASGGVESEVAAQLRAGSGATGKIGGGSGQRPAAMPARVGLGADGRNLDAPQGADTAALSVPSGAAGMVRRAAPATLAEAGSGSSRSLDGAVRGARPTGENGSEPPLPPELPGEEASSDPTPPDGQSAADPAGSPERAVRRTPTGAEPVLQRIPEEGEAWRGERPPGPNYRPAQAGSERSAAPRTARGNPSSGRPQHPTIGDQVGSGMQHQRLGEPSRDERTTKRWGYVQGRATIGLEKKLEIHVYINRILIGPGDAVLRVGEGETREQLVERVLEEIELSTQGWGRPPNNFYWIPAIRFVVYPGGNQHYERLHAPLREAGLFSTVGFALEATPPARALTPEAAK